MKLENRKDVQHFIRTKITSLLNECSPPQQELFHKIYGPVDKIPPNRLANAIDIVERTIKRNERGIGYNGINLQKQHSEIDECLECPDDELWK